MAGTNELALIKRGAIIFTEKGGEAKVQGDEIKREGLKSITNYIIEVMSFKYLLFHSNARDYLGSRKSIW